MANNKIQVKRTSVSGRTPNTTNSGNSQYIDAGELALNMTDGILYTSNGSVLIPVGANNVDLYVTGNATINAIVANGSVGAAGQVLTSNGASVYWATPSGAGGSNTAASFRFVDDQFTGNGSVNAYSLSVSTTTNNAIVSINGVLQEPTDAYSISGTTLTFTENIADGAAVDVRIPVLTVDAYIGGSNNLTTSTTSEQTLDTFSTDDFRSATYFAQVTDNTNNNYHVQHITLVHNGSTVFMSEFGAVYSNGSSLATFDAAISSNTLSLTVTPVVANSSIKVIRTTVAV